MDGRPTLTSLLSAVNNNSFFVQPYFIIISISSTPNMDQITESRSHQLVLSSLKVLPWKDPG